MCCKFNESQLFQPSQIWFASPFYLLKTLGSCYELYLLCFDESSSKSQGQPECLNLKKIPERHSQCEMQRCYVIKLQTDEWRTAGKITTARR